MESIGPLRKSDKDKVVPEKSKPKRKADTEKKGKKEDDQPQAPKKLKK